MHRALLGGLATAWFCLSPAVAQQPTPAPTMLATEHHLFVLRGDVLYQFDVKTLKLRHQFTFPAGVVPALPVAAASALTEPPPPPPLPAARSAEDLGKSLTRALMWLAAHQDDDGRFDCDSFMKHDDTGEPCNGPGNAVHDVGVTGLALLAFLADGSNLREGPWKEQIQKATKWLRSQQDDNGLFGTAASHDFIYDHSIAAFAMSEAYGLSKARILKETAQRGLDYLESHRNPYAVWRYQPRDNDNDTSVTTWALAACMSGKSFDLNVSDSVGKLAAVWYDQVTESNGRAGYTKAGEPSSRHPGDHVARFPPELGEAMTAAALFGRGFLGQGIKDKPILKASADRLLARLPAWSPDRIDPVYWFFGTMGMFQIGGEHWQQWSRALGMLVDHQRKDGNFAGSWDPVGVWDDDGGRVFVTALNALSLASLHRASKLVR
ncbi:MAG: hypothetical protein IPK26_08540 [Planctomycetes bacterium]|nr:hypothetical protein [Planctomycetota bacterium]